MPDAVNSSFWPSAVVSIVTVVVSYLASAIWLATVRFQIRTYRRASSRSSCEDTDDGVSYYLDCVASYPAGLTAAQVAQRVQTSYHYDNNSFSSEADRDDYIRRQLQNEISDEYADRHDGAYPDEKYLNEETERRLAERTGMATPESAQA